ncbi:hypothetical protein N7540_004727 [Penicillium herquei]|nr:hypothetical protein N7540_004727 [Penicillium herquei]
MTLIKASDRVIEFWQNESDAVWLARANFELYIAHTVLNSEGHSLTNLIWKKLEQIPRRKIVWEPIYGLNWCRELPHTSGLWSNSDLDLSGTWQRCEVGQAFALSASGFWYASTKESDSKYLQISRNEYKGSAKEPVYAVIGLYDHKTSGFDPIFVDPIELGLNMGASYQLSDIVQWWYQSTGSPSSPVLSVHKSPVESWDMSQLNPLTNRFYCSTSYEHSKGTWLTNSSTPPLQVSKL